MIAREQIKNVVFDLGGVIIDIDPARAEKAFYELAGDKYPQLMQLAARELIFEKIETGAMSTKQFIEAIQAVCGPRLRAEAISAAWNALLLEIPPARMEALQALHDNYNLYLLSNTNEIHYIAYSAYIQKWFGRSLESYFKQTFLSYRMGYRKPAPEIFHQVIESAGLEAKSSLFVDDTLANAQAAAHAGWVGYHLPAGKEMSEVFKGGRLNMELSDFIEYQQ